MAGNRPGAVGEAVGQPLRDRIAAGRAGRRRRRDLVVPSAILFVAAPGYAGIGSVRGGPADGLLRSALVAVQGVL